MSLKGEGQSRSGSESHGHLGNCCQGNWPVLFAFLSFILLFSVLCEKTLILKEQWCAITNEPGWSLRFLGVERLQPPWFSFDFGLGFFFVVVFQFCFVFFLKSPSLLNFAASMNN